MPYQDPFENFPFVVDLASVDGTTPEGAYKIIAAYNWCAIHCGNKGTTRDWFNVGRKFGFKDANSAIIFKLTWL